MKSDKQVMQGNVCYVAINTSGSAQGISCVNLDKGEWNSIS